jgi:hypothetical protein
MLPISLLNGLIGTICGLRYRFYILVPLIAIATIEVTILRHGGVRSLRFWSALELIVALEIGYLIGSVAAAYRSYPSRQGTVMDFARRWEGKYLHH